MPCSEDLRAKPQQPLGFCSRTWKVGIRNNPKGRGTPQGGVISPLLSNIYLHWFETCATLVAKGMNQVMSIVRYADDFVILARKL